MPRKQQSEGSNRIGQYLSKEDAKPDLIPVREIMDTELWYWGHETAKGSISEFLIITVSAYVEGEPPIDDKEQQFKVSTGSMTVTKQLNAIPRRADLPIQIRFVKDGKGYAIE